MRQFFYGITTLITVALLFGLTACDDSTTDPLNPDPGTVTAQAEVDGETFNFSGNAFFAEGADVEGESAGMAVLFTNLESCIVDEDELPVPPYAVLARETTRPGTGTYPLASFEDEDFGEDFGFFWLDTNGAILSESGSVTVTTSTSDTFAGSIDGDALVMGPGMEEPISGDLSVEFEAAACPDLLIPSGDNM